MCRHDHAKIEQFPQQDKTIHSANGHGDRVYAREQRGYHSRGIVPHGKSAYVEMELTESVGMGLGIPLFVVAIAMIIYVFWLCVHYLKDSFSDNRDIGSINREISENLKRIKGAGNERNKKP